MDVCMAVCVCRFLWRSPCLQEDRGAPCVKSIFPMLIPHTPQFETALRFLSASLCFSAPSFCLWFSPGIVHCLIVFLIFRGSFLSVFFGLSVLVSLYYFPAPLISSLLLWVFRWAETHRHGNWAAAAPGSCSSLAVSGGNRRRLDWIVPVCFFLFLQAFCSASWILSIQSNRLTINTFM